MFTYLGVLLLFKACLCFAQNADDGKRTKIGSATTTKGLGLTAQSVGQFTAQYGTNYIPVGSISTNKQNSALNNKDFSASKSKVFSSNVMSEKATNSSDASQNNSQTTVTNSNTLSLSTTKDILVIARDIISPVSGRSIGQTTVIDNQINSTTSSNSTIIMPSASSHLTNVIIKPTEIEPSFSKLPTVYSGGFTSLTTGSITQIMSKPNMTNASNIVPIMNVTSVTHANDTATKSINISSSNILLSSVQTIINSSSVLPANSTFVSMSSMLPTLSSIHWRTVTVCPWDTMHTALPILPSTNSLLTSDASTALQSSIAPSTWTPHPVASYSIFSNQSKIQPAWRKGCNVVLEGLAHAMGNMTFCMISHLRPMEVCAKCTSPYSVLIEFNNLIGTTNNCENQLILDYNSQYQAIPKLFKDQNNLWQDFECGKCYREQVTGPPVVSWVPKKEFSQSQILVKQIMTCFANYSKGIEIPYLVMLNVSEQANASDWRSNSQICTKCKYLYHEIRKYMKSIHYEGSAEKRWCADMVYGFNETRRIWGQFCREKKEDSKSIIVLTVFFCFIPVVFYIGTKLHSDVKERKTESRVNYESD